MYSISNMFIVKYDSDPNDTIFKMMRITPLEFLTYGFTGSYLKKCLEQNLY